MKQIGIILVGASAFVMIAVPTGMVVLPHFSILGIPTQLALVLGATYGAALGIQFLYWGWYRKQASFFAA